jgi:hypothetical protein
LTGKTWSADNDPTGENERQLTLHTLMHFVGSPVAAKKMSGENDGSSWCQFSVSQVIGYENVRWVSHKMLY